LNSSLGIIRYEIDSCTDEEARCAYKIFIWNSRERYHLEYWDVEMMVILQLIGNYYFFFNYAKAFVVTVMNLQVP